jgi:hypothetical protein
MKNPVVPGLNTSGREEDFFLGGMNSLVSSRETIRRQLPFHREMHQKSSDVLLIEPIRCFVVISGQSAYRVDVGLLRCWREVP